MKLSQEVKVSSPLLELSFLPSCMSNKQFLTSVIQDWESWSTSQSGQMTLLHLSTRNILAQQEARTEVTSTNYKQ